MRDYLLDIVEHTQALGCIDLIKIVGDDKSTTIDAKSDDVSVIIKAEFKTPNPNFKGTFGMPNLVKLNTILNIPEYKDKDGVKAKIELLTQDKNGVTIPTGLHFENATGDFKNDYRFMSSELINSKLESKKFKDVAWDVEFTPAQNALQRFKFQAGANSEETIFIARTDGSDLKFFFGDHSTHAGNFVFHSGITGKLSKDWNWPILRVLSILGLYGDKVMRFCDADGVADITVDSGLIKYQYILPAQRK